MAKRIWLLPQEGAFYKANLHCHTTFSDGVWTPEQVKKEYQARGIRSSRLPTTTSTAFTAACATSTSWRWRRWRRMSTARWRACGTWDTTPVYHLNFYDTDPFCEKDVPLPDKSDYSLDAVNRYIAAMRAKGFLCCYNHPWWSLQTARDYDGLRGLDAFEIFNYGCELEGLYGYAPQAYAELLRAGQKPACFATDDNHNAFAPGDVRCDSFGGFTMLKLPRLGYAEAVSALKNRHCYASNGPLIHALYVEDGTLYVECSPAAKLFLHGCGRRTGVVLAEPGRPLSRRGVPAQGQRAIRLARGCATRPGALPPAARTSPKNCRGGRKDGQERARHRCPFLPAPVNGGFSMEDYWVWCGSVVKGEDGNYHMFASRWPKTLPFHPGWGVASEIVRAVSEKPEGPYRFAEVVLSARGAGWWDGRSVHNPVIQKCDDTYVLFYMGTTYPYPDVPADGSLCHDSYQWLCARANKRIGIATAKSVFGPWSRPDHPSLDVRPGHFDDFLVSNPRPACTRMAAACWFTKRARTKSRPTAAARATRCAAP